MAARTLRHADRAGSRGRLEACAARGDRRRARVAARRCSRGHWRRRSPLARALRAASLARKTTRRGIRADARALARAGEDCRRRTRGAAGRWRALADWLLVRNAAPRAVAGDDAKARLSGEGAGVGASERAQRKQGDARPAARLADVRGLGSTRCTPRAICRRRDIADDALGVSSTRCSQVLPQAVAAAHARSFARAGADRLRAGTLAALERWASADAPIGAPAAARLQRSGICWSTSSRTRPYVAARAHRSADRRLGRRATGARSSPSAIRCSRSTASASAEVAPVPRRAGHGPHRRRCRCEFIDLRRNFRSQAQLVDWANGVFPARARHAQRSVARRRRFVPRRGASATAASRRTAATFDVVRECARTRPRASSDTIAAALAAGAEEVADPGARARAHLDSILPALRAAGIPFAAVELDALGAAAGGAGSRAAHARAVAARRSPGVARGAARALVRAHAAPIFRRRRRGRRPKRGSIAGLRRTAGRRLPGCPTTAARGSRRRRDVLAPCPRRARRAQASPSACAARGSRSAGRDADRRADRSRRRRAISFALARRARGRRRRRRLARRSWTRWLGCMRRPTQTTGRAGAGHDVAQGQGPRVRHRDPAGARAQRSHRGGARSPALAHGATRGLLLAPTKARGGETDPVYRLPRALADGGGGRRARPAALRRLHAREAALAPRCGVPGTGCDRWNRRAGVAPPAGLGAGEALAGARRSTSAAGCSGATLRRAHGPPPLRRLAADCRPASRRAVATRRAGHAGDRHRTTHAAFRLGARAPRRIGTRRASPARADRARRASRRGRIERVASPATRAFAPNSRRKASRRRALRGAARDVAATPSAACSATRADAGCSIPRTTDARSEWALAGVDDGESSRTSPSTARSSRTACAGSSTSRPARTKAATRARSSTAKTSATATQLERYARDRARARSRARSGSRSTIRWSAAGANGRIETARKRRVPLENSYGFRSYASLCATARCRCVSACASFAAFPPAPTVRSR